MTITNKQACITHAGKNFVNELLGMLDGAEGVEATGCGDITWVRNEGEKNSYTILIEAKDGSFNQVRPKCYCVTIGRETVAVERSDGTHAVPSGRYFVIPPNKLVRFAVGKRGQHHVDPIACMGFSMKSKWVEGFVTDYSNLRDAIIAAYLEGEKDIEAKAFVTARKNEWIKQLADNAKAFSKI